jgi:hypothetical protein
LKLSEICHREFTKEVIIHLDNRERYASLVRWIASSCYVAEIAVYIKSFSQGNQQWIDMPSISAFVISIE